MAAVPTVSCRLASSPLSGDAPIEHSRLSGERERFTTKRETVMSLCLVRNLFDHRPMKNQYDQSLAGGSYRSRFLGSGTSSGASPISSALFDFPSFAFPSLACLITVLSFFVRGGRYVRAVASTTLICSYFFLLLPKSFLPDSCFGNGCLISRFLRD